MSRVTDLKVKIFADGADYEGIVKMSRNPVIKGFTTNPTLMRKAGVSDYEDFARKVLAAITDRPVSFEVFADDFASMAEQARTIAAWGPNVNVKIPVTNTKGQPSGELLRALSSCGCGRARSVNAGNRLGVRRAYRRHRHRSHPAYARLQADPGVSPEGATAMGQHARAPEHLPCRGERLRHRHRAERIPEQARSRRQGSRGIFTRDGADILSRCGGGRLSDQDHSLCSGVKQKG
jgi:Transaldolase/Fructose-6-phosphate aldolase